MDTGLALSKAIEGFLLACRARRLSSNTLIDYSRTLRRLLTFAGDIRDDIDQVNRRLKVLGKGNKERLLPFSPRTGSALFRHLAGSEGKPFPFTRNSLAHLVQRIGQRAGISANPHCFRHTFAIMYLRNGGDPYTLQEILGHSSMEMVKRYIALAQVDIDAAHRRASPVEGWAL